MSKVTTHTDLQPEFPTDESRWRRVEAAMRRHGYAADALIETLHAVQEAFGYLPAPALRRVAASLRVPLSKVQGVATFYHLFELQPPARHQCVVCTGTACYIQGAPALLRAVRDCTGVQAGETSPDGEISVATARCVGACSQALVVLFDGETLSHASPEEVAARLREWQRHDP